MIFSHLDLSNLIKIAKTHPRFRDISNIKIGKTISQFEIWTNGYEVGRSPMHSIVILDLIKYYGNHIKKLKVNYVGDNQTEDKTFNRYITRYVGPWLKEINIETFSYHSYDPLIGLGSFPTTECVSITENPRYKTLSNLNLAKMFPAVHVLDIKEMARDSGKWIQHFPHLEHLTFPIWLTRNSSNHRMVAQILQLNPQIRHLGVPACDWKLIILLNKIRPDIESLTLSEMVFHNGESIFKPLRFRNLRKFVCFGSDPHENNPIPLAFGNLEEITFSGIHAQHWIDIMLKNKNLKKIFARNSLNDAQLQKIANSLPNLEEFTMVKSSLTNMHAYLASDNGIVQFMKNAIKLKMFTLKSRLQNNFEGNYSFINQISNEWKYVKDGNDYYCV